MAIRSSRRQKPIDGIGQKIWTLIEDQWIEGKVIGANIEMFGIPYQPKVRFTIDGVVVTKASASWTWEDPAKEAPMPGQQPPPPSTPPPQAPPLSPAAKPASPIQKRPPARAAGTHKTARTARPGPIKIEGKDFYIVDKLLRVRTALPDPLRVKGTFSVAAVVKVPLRLM